MFRTIGILAHVDAGKTTLSEQLLLQGGALLRSGSVDKGDTLLDHDPMERRRGITIFSDQADFTHGGYTYQLIDTPGHVDFAAAMERCLSVLDAAIVVVSAPDGVQGHTETIWRALAQKQVPTVFFINKTDRADPAAAIASLTRLTDAAVCLSDGWEAAAEPLALLDETLLESYLATGFERARFVSAAQKMLMERRLFPVLCGSARTGEGVSALLDKLDALLCPNYDAAAAPGAQVYGIRRDKQGVRFALVKVTGGTLHPRDTLDDCKLGEIRTVQGGKLQNTAAAQAGQLCAIAGLPAVTIGQALGAATPLPAPQMEANLLVKVGFTGDPAPIVAAFAVLQEEDPALQSEWQPESGELTVHIMGPVQLEVLTELLQSRFGLSVSFGPPRVCYRETIAAPVIGYGHFEPLRHYAEVVLRLSPGTPGSGISFASACPTDELAENWQNLIRTHVFERTHRGVLCGGALTDVQITLLAGRAHEKHTEGGDFRQAVYRAIRQGLMQADSRLLEPMTALYAVVPTDCVGRFLSDVQKMHGTCEPPKTLPAGRVELQATAPLACCADYAAAFAAYTRGSGSLSLRAAGYAPCHNPAEVIAESSYEPERDLAHTPDSVFCAHGAGYPVKWQEVPQMAHCHLKG